MTHWMLPCRYLQRSKHRRLLRRERHECLAQTCASTPPPGQLRPLSEPVKLEYWSAIRKTAAWLATTAAARHRGGEAEDRQVVSGQPYSVHHTGNTSTR
ncbi:hypothetical protein RB213_016174, partial [Colletotrichum asianum]